MFYLNSGFATNSSTHYSSTFNNNQSVFNRRYRCVSVNDPLVIFWFVTDNGERSLRFKMFFLFSTKSLKCFVSESKNRSQVTHLVTWSNHVVFVLLQLQNKKQAVRQAGRQTGRQAGRQTDRQKDGLLKRKIEATIDHAVTENLHLSPRG